jgi:hypothetical protein
MAKPVFLLCLALKNEGVRKRPDVSVRFWRDAGDPMETLMATVRKEFTSARSADEVWAKLRRFDAVHELAAGFVTATKIEPSGARMVTFANGVEVREWLVSSDDGARRLVYAILDHPAYQHYSATAQVIEDGAGSRFIWTVDFLPDSMAGLQDASMTAGAAAMAANLR